jgi:hypothetical protein
MWHLFSSSGGKAIPPKRAEMGKKLQKLAAAAVSGLGSGLSRRGIGGGARTPRSPAGPAALDETEDMESSEYAQEEDATRNENRNAKIEDAWASVREELCRDFIALQPALAVEFKERVTEEITRVRNKVPSSHEFRRRECATS